MMLRLLLPSILAATLAIPILASRLRSPVRGLRAALTAFALFELVWVLAVLRFINSP